MAKWSLFLLILPTSLQVGGRAIIFTPSATMPLSRRNPLSLRCPPLGTISPYCLLAKTMASCSVFTSPLQAFSSDDNSVIGLPHKHPLVSWSCSIHLLSSLLPLLHDPASHVRQNTQPLSHMSRYPLTEMPCPLHLAC